MATWEHLMEDRHLHTTTTTTCSSADIGEASGSILQQWQQQWQQPCSSWGRCSTLIVPLIIGRAFPSENAWNSPVPWRESPPGALVVRLVRGIFMVTVIYAWDLRIPGSKHHYQGRNKWFDQ
jgi:hypothetical protein|mmetsp:Transcript_97667/g.164475  ORF Transcript_97667/g.164475 Transcript_97667/m.164475 type:complete len:122 (+) Transcript_97667:401-766(+)|eukprot:CAMPEP_0174291214 /NCGR_PEP_ID=MMETSP0809-20121228/31354_1 /TAXON_ID=73025 ORGANISM="Eutreptiella gymnastica-like, Strain CCMP1594" /NCGR_SAMPLE_ID=MMETSP0809 /ASSEMBLY_ACC=CAM_ASM_000658 /LENGTH=121 /DNA_ID=CAMNT_0015390397 /DNA_START=373 /DNA_END=738 /DNA_ORIENTATION=-